jgi:hydroxymethylpyrimidine pyrophosphatase-like HAD family hydrolase
MVSELIGSQALTNPSLVVADLLADLSELATELPAQLKRGDALDAFLLSAGLVQIADDYLQRDPFLLRRASKYWQADGKPAALTLPLDGIATTTESAMALGRKDKRAARWRDDAAALCDRLAAHALAGDPAPAPPAEIATAAKLRDGVATLAPGLARSVLRIPSCFRSFDQHPRDMARLAEGFRAKHGTLDRPMLVLGVRTSGSYLAPLVAAALRADGYSDVSVATARPGHRMSVPAKRFLRSVISGGGRVAIVDDPPDTGSAVRDIAVRLHHCGLPNDAITLLLPLFGTEAPAALAGYDTVALPFADWNIHQRLSTPAVADALTSLLPAPARDVRRVEHAVPGKNREHARALFDVELAGGERRRVVAIGAGVGYFGRHSIAVAEAVPDQLPETFGFHDGIVIRDWLPEDGRLAEPHSADVENLVSYIRNRAASVPANGDHSVRLSGRQPVWEVAGSVLEKGYGRLGIGLRPIMISPLIKALTAVERPSVIDGATELTNWFHGTDTLYKVDADLRAFANTDLSCYDPIYDLAGIAPGSADTAFVNALRAAMPCDDERFLLYELVHLWDRERAGRAAHRESSRAVQRYVAAQLLTGIRSTPTGALCAIDLDGVLESDALGFPILTPLAALALRALFSHGYQPIPVTGRCLDEVAERCEAYGMRGGVAEYGAVAYNHATGELRELITDTDRSSLGRLRAALRATPGVEVDEDYRRIVRAYRTGRKPLSDQIVRSALNGESVALQVIHGNGQTDFVPAGVGKATGLAALFDLFGDRREIALAVGDAAPDIPMFAMAHAAFAPGNADATVRKTDTQVLRGEFAAGLTEAVARLIGHVPGSCPVCRAPAASARTRTLLTLLDAQRAGRRGLAGSVVHGMSRIPRKLT